MDKIFYDTRKDQICFQGKVVVDVSKVPQDAGAVLYSGVWVDFSGYETLFKCNTSIFPFDLQVSQLSPSGLIKAINENRLEVEGMVVSQSIQDVYGYLWDQDPLLEVPEL